MTAPLRSISARPVHPDGQEDTYVRSNAQCEVHGLSDALGEGGQDRRYREFEIVHAAR